VRSLHRYADRPFDLVIGDSGSQDGSAEMLVRLAYEGWLRVESSRTPRQPRCMAGSVAGDSGCRAHRVFATRTSSFSAVASWATCTAPLKLNAAFVSSALRKGRTYVGHEMRTRTMPRPTAWLMMCHVPSLRPLQTMVREDLRTDGRLSGRSADIRCGSLLYHRAIDAGMCHVGLGWRLPA